MYKRELSASIIILSYNKLDSFEKCIDSISIQKSNKYEVVFSDDCSAKIDIDYIHQYLYRKLPRVNIIEIYNKTNLGTVKNFNNAIKSCSGDIIIPLAMDDFFQNEYCVENILNFFANNSNKLATSYFLSYVDDSVKLYPNTKTQKLLNNNSKFIKKLLTIGTPIRGACMYYSREIFDEIGFFDEKYRLLEDIPFLYKYVRNGYEIGFIPNITIVYSQQGVSSKKSTNPYLMDDRILFSNQIVSEEHNWKVKMWQKYKIARANEPHKKISHALKYPLILIEKILIRFRKKEYIKFKKIEHAMHYINQHNNR